jgi:Flp pilus assembly protein TadG
MLQPDRGSTSLTTVLLTPVFMCLAFTAFQAAMFTHARTEARSVARDAAVLVARQGESVEAVEASAEAVLRDADLLSGTDVEIRVDGTLVVVRLTGNAPGIIRGTSAGIDITESLPIEGFRP